jgi:hypothetical protein
MDQQATRSKPRFYTQDYIATGEGRLYMAAIMHLHTRKIVGWARLAKVPAAKPLE